MGTVPVRRADLIFAALWAPVCCQAAGGAQRKNTQIYERKPPHTESLVERGAPHCISSSVAAKPVNPSRQKQCSPRSLAARAMAESIYSNLFNCTGCATPNPMAPRQDTHTHGRLMLHELSPSAPTPLL